MINRQLSIVNHNKVASNYSKATELHNMVFSRVFSSKTLLFFLKLNKKKYNCVHTKMIQLLNISKKDTSFFISNQVHIDKTSCHLCFKSRHLVKTFLLCHH